MLFPVNLCQMVTFKLINQEAIKITEDEKEYVVIMCHKEVNSPNVIVFDKQKDTLVGEVLNW